MFYHLFLYPQKFFFRVKKPLSKEIFYHPKKKKIQTMLHHPRPFFPFFSTLDYCLHCYSPSSLKKEKDWGGKDKISKKGP